MKNLFLTFLVSITISISALASDIGSVTVHYTYYILATDKKSPIMSPPYIGNGTVYGGAFSFPTHSQTLDLDTNISSAPSTPLTIALNEMGNYQIFSTFINLELLEKEVCINATTVVEALYLQQAKSTRKCFEYNLLEGKNIDENFITTDFSIGWRKFQTRLIINSVKILN